MNVETEALAPRPPPVGHAKESKREVYKLKTKPSNKKESNQKESRAVDFWASSHLLTVLVPHQRGNAEALDSTPNQHKSYLVEQERDCVVSKLCGMQKEWCALEWKIHGSTMVSIVYK